MGYHQRRNMKLYTVTSPSIGPETLVVKAKGAVQASQIAQDVINEGRWTTDSTYTLYVRVLFQPENDGHGYCYPSPTTVTYTVRR